MTTVVAEDAESRHGQRGGPAGRPAPMVERKQPALAGTRRVVGIGDPRKTAPGGLTPTLDRRRRAIIGRELRPGRTRGCLAARERTDGWRLTNRGIAVILITGLVVILAALTVVGMTALRVTSDDLPPDASFAGTRL